MAFEETAVLAVPVCESERNVLVEAMDPGVMAAVVGTEAIRPIADEARRLVGIVLERLVSTQ